MAARLWRLVVIALVAFAPLAVTASADAHDDETEEGYLLVQQALGHLAHDSGPEGVELALEKVGDAQESEDQDGVDVALLEQGGLALEAAEVEQGRALLQESITEAVADLPLATGYETGTGVVAPELPGRDALQAGDWVVLVLSVLVGGVGAWLSVRYRPGDTVAELRRRLGASDGRDDTGRSNTDRNDLAGHPR